MRFSKVPPVQAVTALIAGVITGTELTAVLSPVRLWPYRHNRVPAGAAERWDEVDEPRFETWRDAETLARGRLPADVYDFVAGGAEDEVTLGRNQRAFQRRALLPAVLRDVANVDARVSLWGCELSTPILVAPMGGHSMVHHGAEMATAAGAAAAGVGTITSTVSSTPLEIEATANPARWFQLYVFRDRAVTTDLIARARQAGYGALVVTVDAPVLGLRRRDLSNRFRPEARMANLERYALGSLPDADDGGGLARYFAMQMDPSLTFHDLETLVAQAGLPVIVKGVVRPADAVRCLESGAAGVYVSNHGGRQLDGGPATLDALPAIVDAVAGRAPIVLDGGVRTPSDVVLALALGADAVGVGRPVLWALATGGQRGVEHLLRRLGEGVRAAMALVGARSVDDLTAESVRGIGHDHQEL